MESFNKNDHWNTSQTLQATDVSSNVSHGILPSIFGQGTDFRILFLLAPIVGFVTNGTFQWTTWRNAPLRRNIFAMNLIILSCFDTLSCIFYTVIVYQSIAFLNVYFHYLFVGLNTMHSISTVLIVLISWERYKAICRPLQMATSDTGLFRCLAIHAGWILFMGVVGGPLLLFLWDLSYTTRFPYFYIVLMQFDVAAFFVTMSIYILVAKYLKGEPTSFLKTIRDPHWRRQKEVNLCVMVWINAVVFFSLLVSQHVLPVIAILYLHAPETFLKVQLAFSLSNASVNPIIYNIFGTQYRKAFVKTVLCRKLLVSSNRSMKAQGNHNLSVTTF